MKTKTIFEEDILKEIRELPQSQQEKMARVVRFFKKEIIRPDSNEKSATKKFLSICGTWEDDRSTGEQINDIYLSRRSAGRPEELL